MSYKLLIEKRSLKFLEKLKSNKKQYVQIVDKIFALLTNPYPSDAKKIKGQKETFFRVDVGEFRIVYRVEENLREIQIIIIGKRNDDEIYKQFRRL